MGNKENAIGALGPLAALVNRDVEAFGKRMYPPPAVPPPETYGDPDNQSVAKDMTIQALREDIKAQLAGELEVSWSYVALFAVAAAQIAEGFPKPPHDPAVTSWTPPTVLLEGDKLEQVFGEYEFKRESYAGGAKIMVIRRKDQKTVLCLRINLPPGAASL